MSKLKQIQAKLKFNNYVRSLEQGLIVLKTVERQKKKKIEITHIKS